MLSSQEIFLVCSCKGFNILSLPIVLFGWVKDSFKRVNEKMLIVKIGVFFIRTSAEVSKKWEENWIMGKLQPIRSVKKIVAFKYFISAKPARVYYVHVGIMPRNIYMTLLVIAKLYFGNNLLSININTIYLYFPNHSLFLIPKHLEHLL